MSAMLYATRLYWDEDVGQGGVKMNGIYRRISHLPSIKGLPKELDLIDYAPETNTSVITLHGGHPRPMTEREEQAVMKFLDGYFPVVIVGVPHA